MERFRPSLLTVPKGTIDFLRYAHYNSLDLNRQDFFT